MFGVLGTSIWLSIFLHTPSLFSLMQFGLQATFSTLLLCAWKRSLRFPFDYPLLCYSPQDVLAFIFVQGRIDFGAHSWISGNVECVKREWV